MSGAVFVHRYAHAACRQFRRRVFGSFPCRCLASGDGEGAGRKGCRSAEAAHLHRYVLVRPSPALLSTTLQWLYYLPAVREGDGCGDGDRLMAMPVALVEFVDR